MVFSTEYIRCRESPKVAHTLVKTVYSGYHLDTSHGIRDHYECYLVKTNTTKVSGVSVYSTVDTITVNSL